MYVLVVCYGKKYFVIYGWICFVVWVVFDGVDLFVDFGVKYDVVGCVGIMIDVLLISM